MINKKSPFQNLRDDLIFSTTFTAEYNALFDAHMPFGKYIKDLKNQYQQKLNTYREKIVVIDISKNKKVDKVITWTNYWARLRNDHKQFLMNEMVANGGSLTYDFVICALLTNILTINYLPEDMLDDELIVEIAYKLVTKNVRIFKYLPKQLQSHPLFLTYVTRLVEAEPLNGQIIRELKKSLVADKFQSYINRYNLDKESFARSCNYRESNVANLCYKSHLNSPFASTYNANIEIEQ